MADLEGPGHGVNDELERLVGGQADVTSGGRGRHAHDGLCHYWEGGGAKVTAIFKKNIQQ